ncbi:MAG TPA: hypothetical protein VK073_00445 [Pseudogracilibacillus sp.]|nr:hypothetical protein [Pseudogracilibacillus sp.]
MKKYLFLLIIIAIFILTSCANSNNNETTNVESGENEQSDSNEESVEVDKNLLSVEVTIPANLLELDDGEVDIDEITEEAKEQGIKKVTQNNDGSITYKMTKSAHKDFMQEMKEDLNENIDEIVSNDEYTSIKKINPNKKFTKFDVVVDREKFENNFDGFAVLGVGFGAMFYQLFDGVDENDYKATFNYVDEDTEEVFDSVTYPEAFDENENGEGDL